VPNSKLNLAEAFEAADISGFPDVRTLGDERKEALWVLWVGREKAATAVMSAADVSSVLRDVFGIHVSRQRAQSLLAAEKRTVVPRRNGRETGYQIMQAGIDEVAGSSMATYIDPDRALSSIRKVEAILSGLTGTVRLCDPYVDGRTLDLLTESKKATSIQLLTANVNDVSVLMRDIKAFHRQHGNHLEVRIAKTPGLHDRYAIDDIAMMMFGTSLNGIGFKQSFIVALGPDIRASMIPVFDSTWSQATAL
jgi:hypothetical protein